MLGQQNKQFKVDNTQLNKSNKMLVESVKDHHALEEKYEESLKTVDKLRSQLTKTEDKNVVLLNTVEETQKSIEQLKQTGTESEEKTKEIQTHLYRTKMQLKMATEESDNLKEKYREAEREALQLRVQVGPLKDEIKSMRVEHAMDCETLETTIDGLRGDIRSLEGRIRSMLEEKDMLNGEINQRDAIIEEMTLAMAHKDEEIAQAALHDKQQMEELHSLQIYLQEEISKSGHERSALLQSKRTTDGGEGVAGPPSKVESLMRSMVTRSNSMKVRQKSMTAASLASIAANAASEVMNGSAEKLQPTMEDDEDDTESSKVVDGPYVPLSPSHHVDGFESHAQSIGKESHLNSPTSGAQHPSDTEDSDDESVEEDVEEDDGSAEKNVNHVQEPRQRKASRRGGISASPAAAEKAAKRASIVEGVRGRLQKPLTITPPSPGSISAQPVDSTKNAVQNTLNSINSSISQYTVSKSLVAQRRKPSIVQRPNRNMSMAQQSPFRPGETVELLAVRDGASDEEIALREAILCTLTATVGPIPAKKAINALAPVCALYGGFLTGALDGFWDSLIQIRRSSDFLCKLNVIFEKIISCGSAGVTAQDVGRICGECIPLAMASLGGSNALTSWQQTCKIHSGMGLEMSGTIDPTTGDLVFKKYDEFFGNQVDVHTY